MSHPPRRFCCDEDLFWIGYDGQNWESELARLRTRGPRPWTAELVTVLVRQGVADATVLDIGAGVGAVHLALLEAGAARAVDVDASREYQGAARMEAELRGLADRVTYHYGDVAELADVLLEADVVTADAVICCYPYLDRFLEAAVRSEPRLVGLTLPADRWLVRARLGLSNALAALRRRMDHYYLHRHGEIDRLLVELGYRAIHRGGSWYWSVLVYHRGPSGPAL